MFHTWLLAQRERADAIGHFARAVGRDALFPRRTVRLYLLLRYYDTDVWMREALKLAHREWRRQR